MPIVSTIRMTARQFLELGEDPPGVHLELVDGEIAVSPSPIPDHSYLQNALTTLLFQHIKANRLGRLYADVDTIFGPHDVRRPDLIFFSTARLHLVGKKSLEGPPDLCVEILSPSSVVIDRKDKYEQYQAAGVPNYWIVDPAERTIEGFTLRAGKYHPVGSGRDTDTVRLPPFPDLEIPLAELWHPTEA